MGALDGTVAIVTGAGGGIGREHALLLAREGARVVVNDYGGDPHGHAGTSEMAEQVVKEILDAGGEAVGDAHDVALEPGAIVQTALDAFGGLQAVVNNAGISGGGELDQITEGEYQRMLDIHLGGTIGVCRAAWPILKAQRYGRIVNTSSASVFGLPGTSHYITAKAAIFGFTRALAQDGMAYEIKVNAIMPTAYSRLTAQSEQFAALMKAGFPAERIAPFVAALLTDSAPCTGETFVVGGGRAARVTLGTVVGLAGFTSVQDVLDRFDEALASEGATIPANSIEEVVFECANLGIDIASYFGPAPS